MGRFSVQNKMFFHLKQSVFSRKTSHFQVKNELKINLIAKKSRFDKGNRFSVPCRFSVQDFLLQGYKDEELWVECRFLIKQLLNSPNVEF